jgi:uncharacterized protein (TIGR03067 family)
MELLFAVCTAIHLFTTCDWAETRLAWDQKLLFEGSPRIITWEEWAETLFAWQDRQRLQGTWKVIAWEEDGKPAPASRQCWNRVRFTRLRVELTGPHARRDEGECELYLLKTPRSFRFLLVCHEWMSDSGWQCTGYHMELWFGVYRIEGKRLVMCLTSEFGTLGSSFPGRFSTRPGDDCILLTLERETP